MSVQKGVQIPSITPPGGRLNIGVKQAMFRKKTEKVGITHFCEYLEMGCLLHEQDV